MRITHNMLADTTLRNLNANMERLDRLQDELTSGRRISRPSDDPVGVVSAMGFRSVLAEIEQYERNVDAAQSWLEASDSSLNSVTSILQRVRELAVQGASDTTAISDKQAIAAEVARLTDQVVSAANSTYAGQYLFAGYKVNVAPFTPVGDPPTSIAYAGDSGEIERKIDRSSAIIVNTPGDAVFNQVFSTLIALRDDLNSGNSSAVSARIGDIDQAMQLVLSARGSIGAKVNRLSTQKNSLEDMKTNVTGLLSRIQDVDMVEAATEFATQQNIYKAALAAGAKAIQPSLLDFLR